MLFHLWTSFWGLLGSFGIFWDLLGSYLMVVFPDFVLSSCCFSGKWSSSDGKSRKSSVLSVKFDVVKRRVESPLAAHVCGRRSHLSLAEEEEEEEEVLSFRKGFRFQTCGWLRKLRRRGGFVGSLGKCPDKPRRNLI